MKKKLLMVYMMILSLGISTAFAAETGKKDRKDDPAKSENTENKLSEEEISRLTKRVEEIRDMDKSNLTIAEKREMKKELKGIKETVKKDGGYIYIGAGTLLVILLIVILLL